MKSISIFFLLSCILLSSCKKLGCTDENATNFEKVAQKSDGSCTYKGSIGIWFDEDKSMEYNNLGIQSLTYYINGIEAGSTPIWLYGDPNSVTCIAQSTFIAEFNMGKVASQTHKLLVKSETGALVDNYVMTVEGGKCTLFQMK